MTPTRRLLTCNTEQDVKNKVRMVGGKVPHNHILVTYPEGGVEFGRMWGVTNTQTFKSATETGLR